MTALYSGEIILEPGLVAGSCQEHAAEQIRERLRAAGIPDDWVSYVTATQVDSGEEDQIDPSEPTLDGSLAREHMSATRECGACHGSGEGMHSDSRCLICHGRGVVARRVAG